MAEYVYINGRERPDFILNNNYLSYGKHFEMHTHRMLEFNVQKEGLGTYRIGTRQYESRPGDIFILSNTEPHQLIPNPGSQIYNLNIHFDPEIFCTSFEKAIDDIPLLAMFFRRTETFSHVLNRDNPDTGVIYRLFHEIEREALEKRPLYHLQIKMLLERICLEILRSYDYCELQPRPRPNANPDFYRISKTMDYIDYNIGKSLTLEKIAQVACMSPSYFSSVFKRYCGIALFEYIAQKRIEYAALLLRTAAKSIADIAYTCGFNNLTSFNKAFLRIHGCQPSVYRKRKNEWEISISDVASIVSPVCSPQNGLR
ncbi:MAG: AraC family transcriptional regulator [Oscillospiraceae bacterium]|jgi:AraC-like DNA-binding protein|nr:AraC family transcriptional regulator [Oscillospiraceae bacterium]